MEKLQIRKRIYALLAAVLLLFSLLFGNVTMTANAEGQQVAQSAFETRSIEEDFADFEKEDSSFSIKLFGQMATGQPSILKFVEYGFSKKEGLRGNYGLYLYVYNPSGLPIDTDTCVVNMATSYNSDGTPSGYDNVELEYLDSYDSNLLVDLFDKLNLVDGGSLYYKFKVKNATVFYERVKAYEKIHSGKRRYDIAGVQFKQLDEVQDFTDGKTYYFSGYAKGYDDSSLVDSTLSSQVAALETINPKVYHTFYREDVLDEEYYDTEINTVYFGIPTDLLNRYDGKVEKIKAEWFEYKTFPIFVTEDDDAYADLKSELLGVDLVGNENISTENCDWRVIWEEESFSVRRGTGMNNSEKYHIFQKSFNGFANGKGSYTENQDWYEFFDTLDRYYWNGDTGLNLLDIDISYSTTYVDENGKFEVTPLRRMDWLLHVDDVGEQSDYDVQSDKVEEYMQWYTENYGATQNLIGGRYSQYAENLFSDSIDESRISLLQNPEDKRGLVVQEISSSDKLSLLGDDMLAELETWNAFWSGVLYDKYSYLPIVALAKDDLSMSNADFSETFMIQKSQVATVKERCKDMLAKGETPILFRFAKTDYYSSAARFDLDGHGTGMSSKDGYVAQETVFLDFDTISITLGEDTSDQIVLGVVSEPMNIINGTTAPSDVAVPKKGCADFKLFDFDFDFGCGSFDSIIQVVLILLFTVAFFTLLPLVKGIVYVLCLPLKFIKWLFSRKKK